MKSVLIYGLLTAFVMSWGIVVYHTINKDKEASKDKMLYEIAQQRSKILEDQSFDVLAQLTQDIRNNNIEIARSTGRIEGMATASMNLSPNSNEISNIWHNGYYRGLDQLSSVEHIIFTKGFIASKKIELKKTTFTEKEQNDLSDIAEKAYAEYKVAEATANATPKQEAPKQETKK